MAFQRPFLISMKRNDSQRWGFGITGGKEYGQPLRIQMVAEDSIAECCGLHEGDEIIQVGRINVQDMSQGQVYELLARCGNKIEMFVIREDLLAPRKGKEPPVVKAVVHNQYNSPLQLYSTENVADTLAKQTEILTEGRISTDEEDEGPENLSFKQKSAVFQLLEEQAKQENTQKPITRGSPQRQTVIKPKAAPPPPPKPKPPAQESLYNGYDTTQRQVYQDQQKTSRVEYQTTQKFVNQYQYQQQQPVQYQQVNSYQTSSYQASPGYQSPVTDKNYSPGYQSSGITNQQRNYQQTHQQTYQPGNYQQPQSPRSPVVNNYQQYPGYQSPVTNAYQPLNQVNYQQNRGYQQTQTSQPKEYQIQIQTTASQQSPREQKSPTAVSKAEFKIGPPPPPRGSSATKQKDDANMTAVYKQQYEQHLQQQYQQQQMYMNNLDTGSLPKAHIIKEDIFEHNSTSGTPITYKAPPAAPPKPHWPPPPTPEQFRSPAPPSPTSMRVDSAWPPKKSTVTELPRTGFNLVREQGAGRKCVWPPPKSEEEYRSGGSTPQSPGTGRRIIWNPSPSPPTSRRVISPARRKDIQWPPASPTSMMNEKEIIIRGSPRLTRKGRFEDYIREHASINVPQTYRPPPGTQHVEYR